MSRNTAMPQPIPRTARPTEEQIRARAYELFLERGQSAGDPVADWLQAERELIARAATIAPEPKSTPKPAPKPKAPAPRAAAMQHPSYTLRG
jgi:hypothetical protein